MARARTKRTPWTAQDLKLLRTLAGRLSTARLAKRLKRTVLAVRFKAHTKSISLAQRGAR